MKLMSPWRYSDDVLRAVLGDEREAELLEHRLEHAALAATRTRRTRSPSGPSGCRTDQPCQRSACMRLRRGSRLSRPARVRSRNSAAPLDVAGGRALEVGDLGVGQLAHRPWPARRGSAMRSGNDLAFGDDRRRRRPGSCLPMTAPFITTAWMPIRVPSPIVQPCSIAWWPTVTRSPIFSGCRDRCAARRLPGCCFRRRS